MVIGIAMVVQGIGLGKRVERYQNPQQSMVHLVGEAGSQQRRRD